MCFVECDFVEGLGQSLASGLELSATFPAKDLLVINALSPKRYADSGLPIVTMNKLTAFNSAILNQWLTEFISFDCVLAVR